MATITIPNLPDELVEQIKQIAKQKGISMEQEIRSLLQSRYVQRRDVIARICQRNKTLPSQPLAEIKSWREKGRL